jgi:hypothetical protein
MKCEFVNKMVLSAKTSVCDGLSYTACFMTMMGERALPKGGRRWVDTFARKRQLAEAPEEYEAHASE